MLFFVIGAVGSAR